MSIFSSLNGRQFLIAGTAVLVLCFMTLFRQSIIHSIRQELGNQMSVAPAGVAPVRNPASTAVSPPTPIQSGTTVEGSDGCPTGDALTAKLRNDLANISRAMNAALEKKGQMECELKKNGRESTVGGWCNTGNLVAAHMHDTKLATFLSKFFTGKHIGSFGDGSGRYQEIFMGFKEVANYTSYDGNPYSKQGSKGLVNFLDLSVPQYWPPKYDWIMSLEVAEHIPQQYEQAYLDNLARHAKEGIVMSWAVVGQGGRSHINNRPDEYVRAQLLQRGFVRDEEESKKAKAAATLDWLRRNTNIYRRNKQVCL